MPDSPKSFVINFVIGNFAKTLRKKWNLLGIRRSDAYQATKSFKDICTIHATVSNHNPPGN